MPNGKGTYGKQVGRPKKSEKLKKEYHENKGRSFWNKATGGRMK